MGKFVLLYTGGGMPESEEEQAAVLAAWGAWYTNLGEAVVDPGNPTGPVVKYINSDRSVSDGAVGAHVSGYTIISADSMEAAVGLAKGCPVLDGNGQVSVYETFDVM